jgi:hypothetical protein
MTKDDIPALAAALVGYKDLTEQQANGIAEAVAKWVLPHNPDLPLDKAVACAKDLILVCRTHFERPAGNA